MDKSKQHKLLLYKQYLENLVFSPTQKLKEKITFALKWFVIRSGFFYSKPVREQCDVLFVHTYDTEPQRLGNLIGELRKKGLSIRHTTYSISKAIKNKELIQDSNYHSISLSIYASYVGFLMEKYNPKVLVTLENSLIISPIIKEKIKSHGVYVNISHGVTPNQHFHTMVDFDYYFLFGKSSLRNLLNNPVRFGNSKVIFTGSPYIDYQNKENTNFAGRITKVLFFSSWFPKGEIGEVLQQVFHMVVEWAMQQPAIELLIKVHPLEDPTYVQKYVENISNIRVLDKSKGMVEALEGVQVVLNQWSNASVEAAVLGLPTVVVNPSNISDEYLYLEEFFPKRATSVSEIDQRIKEVESNYDYYKVRTKQFFEYHLAKVEGSMFISDQIAKLHKGEELDNFVEIKEAFNI
jgi:hypothetical protein